MGTYVALAFLLLVTAVVSRSGAQPKSPSLAQFSAFCNDIAGSGGAPSPLIDVLCRQVAERAAPPSDTASWSGVESLSVSEEAPTATTDLPTTLQVQQADQANEGEVTPQETNQTSDSQPRANDTLDVDNGVSGADNVTETFRVLERQSVIVLNNTLPQQQVDLGVIDGSESNSNLEEAVASTVEKSNRSVVQPDNNLVHLQPHNVSTFYMGERAQSELLGGERNVPHTSQAPTTNVKTLKRGDQMPVPENQSRDSLAFRESSRNQTFNNAETLDQLPEVVPQQSQSDVYNSNDTLNVDQSTDIFRIPETEQKEALADRTSATEDSINEGQVDVEQVSTTVTTESEAPSATEVARDSLYTSSGRDMTAGEMQDAGFGSAGNGYSAQSGIQVADGPSSSDGFFDVQPSISKNIQTQEHDTTQSTTGETYEQVSSETSLTGRSATFPTLGNEQSLTSEQGTTGGQSTADQAVEGIPQQSLAEDTQVDQGEGNYTPKRESAVGLKGSNESATESTTLTTESTIVDTGNPALTSGEESKGQLPDILGQNLGNYNPNGAISTNNMASEQDILSNPKNGMGVGQQTLITRPAENSDKPENPPSQSVSVDLPAQALPGNTEGSDPAGSATQQTNQEARLPGDGNSPTGTTTEISNGVSSSVNPVNSTAILPKTSASTSQLPLGVSSSEGNSFASALLQPNASGSGSANQPSVGESSSEGNPVASTSLPPNPSGSTNKNSLGVSSSEGRPVASPSLPPTPSGSANQPSVGMSSSEGNPVASTSLLPNPAGSTSEPSAGMSSSEGNSAASTSLPANSSGSANQSSAGVSSSEGNPVASTSLPPNPAGSTSEPSAGMSSSEGNSVASTSLPPNTSGSANQPSGVVSYYEINPVASPPNPAGSANQPSVGVSSTEGNSVASPSLPPNPSGSTGQPGGGVSSSEVISAATTPLPPTSEGDYITDSMLLLKELSTKFLESLADIHCRQSVNDFWKKVTEVIRRLSVFHKPTVRDMTSSVTEVIESYRRESPYWTTIAAKLEQATSDGRWRQMVGALARRRRGDPASQLRLLRASRQLREAVRAAVSAPECRSAGAQPAAERCERFLLCYRAGWQWRAVSLSCPAGSAFSRTERRCVWRPLAGCSPAPSFVGWVDDDGDSDSDYDTSEERSWSRLGHAHSLFRMFDFHH